MCSSETESCKNFVSSHLSALKRLLIKSESNTRLTSRGVSSIETLSCDLFFYSIHIETCYF